MSKVSYHDCHMVIVHAVVIDWRLQKMRILFKPKNGLVN